MATPPPPPTPAPNPGQGQLFGTNNLGSQIDALTRAFTTFTNRFASAAGLGTIGMHAYNPMSGQGRTGEQLGRLQQNYLLAQGAHNAAYQRMREDLERQQLQWDRQLRAGNRTMANMKLPAWQRQEAQDRLDEQAILFSNAQSRTRRNWAVQENQFSAAMTTMNTDMVRLQRQQRQQTTLNRIAFAAQTSGAVIGAAKTYYSGGFEEQLGQFERRFSMMRPDWTGTAGTRARDIGREMKRYGAVMWGTSNEDVFTGATSILQQSPLGHFDTQMRRASSAAYITPGLGIQGAAQMQQELGTAQAFYASQMYGLTPTRYAGGVQNSSAAMALSLAQRVNAGRFGQLSGTQLQAQLTQGGSLSMSMANYAKTAGLSGQSVEAMRNQLELMRDLMNPSREGLEGLSEEEALRTIENAGRRDTAGERARARITRYAPSVGKSYQDSQRYLQGLSREGHLPASASFLDAARASANTLADIHTLLQKTLEPFADVIGRVSGTFRHGAVAGVGTMLKRTGKGVSEGSDWLNLLPVVGPWLNSILGGDTGTPESKQGGGRKTSDGGGSLPSGGVSKAISYARAQVGDQYILGANGPDAWDCSSLMQAAFKEAGVNLPRVTYDQINAGVEVPIDEVRPGDMVFYSDLSHVGLYAGDGKVIEAANPGRGVIEGPLYGKYKRARRVLSGGVAAKETLSGAQSDPTSDHGGGGGGYSVSGAYGSVEEVDALAAALAGGGGSEQAVSRTPRATQNEEADDQDAGAGTSKDKVTDTRSNVKLGRKMAAEYGWTGKQFDALYKLWTRESGWNHRADNPTSDAYGIPQAMSNLYPETATSEWRNSPSQQIAWGLKYIKNRYGNPQKAWDFWNSRYPHWYADGAWEVPGQPGQGLDAKLHGGEMVLDRNSAHTVRQALLNQGLTPSPGQGAPMAGAGGSVTLQFDAGSVVVQMPAASPEGAKSAAQAFVSHIAADERIKTLMGGW